MTQEHWEKVERKLRDIIEESDKVKDTDIVETGEIRVILVTGQKILISVSGYEETEN